MEPRIETRDGKVTIAISASLDAEQLRGLLAQLCEAHAQLTGVRGPQGQPAFAWAGGDFQVQGLTNGRVRFSLVTPVFGLVGTDAPVLALLRVLGAIATSGADLLEAAQTVPPRDADLH